MRGNKRFIALAVVLLLVGAAGIFAYIAERETAAATLGDGLIVQLPGPDLHVEQQGPKSGSPIVLLHCYSCSSRWWDPVLDRLAERHRVTTIDLLGHGMSAKPASGYSIPAQAEAVRLTLDALGIDRALIVGHSMGGVVGTALAERNPELFDGLVALGVAAERRYSQLPLLAEVGYLPVIGPALVELSPDALLESGLSRVFAPGFEVPGYAVEDLHRMTYPAYRDAARESRGFVAALPLQERLADARFPIVYVQGMADRIVDPATTDAWAELPTARIETLPDVGHSPQIERPRATSELILNYRE